MVKFDSQNAARVRRGVDHRGLAVRPFAYGFEPLCRAACLCYAVSHWLVPDAWKGPLWRGYFSDALLIPAALPWFLWLQRKLGLRAHDDPPRWSEILGTLCIWAFAAEVVAPHWFVRATGDPWDGVAYALGAVSAGIWWHKK